MPAPSRRWTQAEACCRSASSPSKAISSAARRWPAVAPDGAEVARGLINYGSGEARRIARKLTAEIESLLGYVDEPELIHRDNLILLV